MGNASDKLHKEELRHEDWRQFIPDGHNEDSLDYWHDETVSPPEESVSRTPSETNTWVNLFKEQDRGVLDNIGEDLKRRELARMESEQIAEAQKNRAEKSQYHFWRKDYA